VKRGEEPCGKSLSSEMSPLTPVPVMRPGGEQELALLSVNSEKHKGPDQLKIITSTL
jgi:hypothetical protein